MTSPNERNMSRPDAWKFQPTSLKDKKILITGGTTGMGRTIALLLAQQGARIMIFSRDSQHVNDALADFRAYGQRVFAMTADVADPQDVARVFEQVDEKLGGLDILINNAGLPADSVTGEDIESIHYVVDTNLLGYMYCAAHASSRLPEDGSGHIVNIGSLSAESRGRRSDVYVATKSGIRGWSASLGKQLSERNIRVTLIEPGLTGANFFRGEKSQPQTQRNLQAERKMMTSEDVAETVLYCLTLPPRANVAMLQLHELHHDDD